MGAFQRLIRHNPKPRAPDRQTGAPLVVRVQSRSCLRNPENEKHNTHNKKLLWQADPHCHWCGIKTFLPGPGQGDEHDAATIDHVYPKMHPERATKGHIVVLACRLCNTLRDWQAKLEWRREKTGRFGRIRRVDPERRANALRMIHETKEET